MLRLQPAGSFETRFHPQNRWFSHVFELLGKPKARLLHQRAQLLQEVLMPCMPLLLQGSFEGLFDLRPQDSHLSDL